MTTDPKLLPCPFCGAHGDTYETMNGEWVAWCSAQRNNVSFLGKTKADAIAAWNRRPSPWIACAERMPEPRKAVLVRASYPGVLSDDTALADWFGERWWFHDDGPAFVVTHWMEIPPVQHDRLPPPPAPEGES